MQDPFGFQVEYYAHMEQAPWLLQQYHLHRHGCPTRLDHLNVLMPDAQAGFDWYTRELGFYCSEFTASAPPENAWASWLYRKATIHDIAVMTGKGPSVHHAGFADGAHGRDPRLRRAAAAGYADNIERGPARHGISNALFVYVRDPDGNRFELYTGDYLTVDRDQAPKRWELDNPRRQSLWGPPPPPLVRGIHDRGRAGRRQPAAGVRADHPRHPHLYRLTRPARRISAMNRHVIVPPTGLLPHRPYSPAIQVDRLLFVSGHTGSDPVTRAFSDDITEQTELAFRNIQSVIEAAGAAWPTWPRPPSS